MLATKLKRQLSKREHTSELVQPQTLLLEIPSSLQDYQNLFRLAQHTTHLPRIILQSLHRKFLELQTLLLNKAMDGVFLLL